MMFLTFLIVMLPGAVVGLWAALAVLWPVPVVMAACFLLTVCTLAICWRLRR